MAERKTLQDLTIKDNFMFGAVMMDEEICRELLELVLGFRIAKVTVSKEKCFVYHPEYKGVRLDILAADEKNTHYNVEMQVFRKRKPGKRSRYYHSQIDMELLRSGQDYEELPDSYVIFICDFDPFYGKKYRYTFDMTCREDGSVALEDGSHTVFLSTCGENEAEVPEELVKFLRYVKAGLKESIGIDGFEKIRTNDFYYADKTLFIKELLQNWGEVNLFTRPRRFGKSLNMSMLKSFFEIGSNPALFEGLEILQEKELCEKYMGKFPVISISLKSVDGLNYEAAVTALRRVIGNEACRFDFLTESERLSQNDKELYMGLTTVKDGKYLMTDDLLTDSLKTLSLLLEKHYDQKTILLIDEYDVPLDKAFQAGYYDEMVSLIRNLLGNVLKTNDSLYFAVLTGCLRISKESIFTGLNNPKVHTISDVRYDEYFGFTNSDVDELLEFYGLSSYKNVIRDWYDGYRFGDTDVYCPWDVINYCDELLADPGAEPENYWANTSGNDLILRLLKKANQTTRNDVEQLINGETITKTIRQELTYREVEESIDNIWSVLYSTGYLTCRRRVPGKKMELALPNREVRELFIELVKDWFEETTQADSARINRFCAAFPAGDTDVIQEMLGDYLWDSISVRDTAVRRNMKENFYHGMLLGLLGSQGSWLVRSNAETGEGYSDISIQTPDRVGIVIELKYADDGNLENACEEALGKIEEKKYAEGLKRRGTKKIIKYGIAFWEKECMVMMA